MKKILLLIGSVMMLAGTIKSQISGTFNVPGTYATIEAAITDINTQGISGPVTINVAAGHTETASAVYTLTTTGTAANQIIFQKNGAGANPIITAYSGGTGTPGTAVQDGIWALIGTDYITIDGIDLLDANTANPATMEYGYGLFKAAQNNGCQNNTIKNCVITLKRDNNASGSAPAVDGSRGIDMVNALQSAHNAVVTVTAAAGSNSNNKFYSNTIQNCNIGIALIGFADVSPFTFADTGNDIGGTSIATGNSILNYGGATAATNPAAGVRTLAQYGINVSYNLVNSNNGSGVNHPSTLRGIYLNTAVSANATINNNTVTIKGGGTTSQLSGIENVSGSTAAANTININNNSVINCTYLTATSANYYCIFNTGTPANLNINNNIITGNASNGTSGSYYMINNTGAVTTSISIANNNINGFTFNAATTSAGFRGINNTGAASTSSLTIANNNLQAITYTGAGSGAFDGFYNSGTANSQNILNNTLTNLSINTSGAFQLLFCNNTMPVGSLRTISGNSIVTGFSKTLAGGTCYGYYSNSTSAATSNEVNTNNNLSNITVVGATALNVWYTGDGTTTAPYGPGKTVTNNVFTNITGGTSAVIGLVVGYSNNGSTTNNVSNNLVSNITGAGAITGIQLTQGNQNATNNSVNSFTSTGATSAVIGINVTTNGTTENIIKNKIYNLENNQAGGTVTGISISSAVTNNVFNNYIGDLRTGASTGNNSVIGINLTGGTTNNVYYNTVHINGTSSAANFGSSAINTNGTSTTINLRNNIFINNTTPTGTGLAVAFRRSVTALTNYGTASNNNVFYAGTPSATNLIFYDGTTSYQTLPAFKTAVTPREVASLTENTPFLSLSGPATNFLHVNPSVASVTEGGAINISGITDDYDSDIRQGNPGYTGTGIAPDIGADEYNQILPGCSSATSGTIAPASTASCSGQAVSMNATGFTTGSGITYQWQVSPTSGGPYSNVVGGSGANTPAYTTATLAAGNYYFVMVTTCSVGPVSGTSNEATVTINATPTASILSNAPVCSGQNLNLTAGTDVGTGFVWTGPNSFSSATQNPSINNAGLNAGGVYTLIVSTANCTSTPVTASLTINATPAAITVTPSSATICAGASQTLTASGGNIPLTMSFGTQAAQNTAVTTAPAFPAPYTAYYGGQKMQILVLASELTAAGFVANSPLTSIQFPVVSKGSNWGTSINENQNFQVNIGLTAATNLTAFQTGLTNVVAPMNFTPTVGYNNIHTFSTPFIWDGTSNVVVETTWSNNFSGGTNDLVVSYNTPTPSFTSTIVYRVDSQTAATVAGATTITFSYTARPDFKFNGEAVSVFSWSPSATLSSPTGTNVVATPASSTIYTVSVANGSCTSNANVSVSVTPIPTVSITATPTTICAGSSATLTASGATTYSWNTNSTNTVISVAPTANTSYTVTGFNGTCTNTAVQSVSVNALPTVSATTSASLICNGQSATLTASGANTYSWNTTSTNTVIAVSPTTTTSYTVTGTTNGCSNTFVISQAVSGCVGINANVANPTGILVYPNPNTGEFTIELNNGSVKTIDVMDLTGRIVVSASSSNDKVDFNINSLANGVYYVRIQSNNAVDVIKIVKQ